MFKLIPVSDRPVSNQTTVRVGFFSMLLLQRIATIACLVV